MNHLDQDQQMNAAELQGTRILIVEDEYYLAEDLAEALRQAGAQVAGPAGSLRQAEQQLQAGAVTGAIIDMNLRGETAFALAERLQAAAVPFVIVSGYSREALPASLGDVPRLEKPINAAEAVTALGRLLAH